MIRTVFAARLGHRSRSGPAISRSARASISHDQAVPEPDLPVGRGGDLGAVRHDHQGDRPLAPGAGRAGRGPRAAVAESRLPVGSSASSSDGLVGQRPGDRDPLPLADREPPRRVPARGAPARPPPATAGPAPARSGRGVPAANIGTWTFSRCREGRDQVERLEDEADLAGPEGVEVELRQRPAPVADLARGRPVEPAEQVQQRALAAPRRPGDRHELALGRRRATPRAGPARRRRDRSCTSPSAAEQGAAVRSLDHSWRSASVGSSRDARTAG